MGTLSAMHECEGALVPGVVDVETWLWRKYYMEVIQ